jgi:hypothetical protein
MEGAMRKNKKGGKYDQNILYTCTEMPCNNKRLWLEGQKKLPYIL